MKFFQPPTHVCRGAYIPYLNSHSPPPTPPTPPFLLSTICLEECLNSQVKIKNANGKETYCRLLPSPSELTSRVHPLIFL